MQALFDTLYTWFQANFFLAIFASFIWGILSIILSPCHLSSLPLIIAYISERKVTVKKAFFISVVFSLGVLLSISGIGIITGLMGKLIGDIGIVGNILIGVLFIVMGLTFLGVIKLDALSNLISPPEVKKKSYITVLVLGIFFGIGLGPCTFAFMAPLLGIVFTTASTNLPSAILLLGAFALGHCIVLIVAGTLSKAIEKLMKWNESSSAVKWIKRICGILLILGGIYFLADLFIKIK